MHDSVTATFGGREITFKIDRQDLPLFEAYAGIPAIEMFMRITGGRWTVQHLKSVLTLASVSADKLAELRQFTGALRRMAPGDTGLIDSYLKGCAPHVRRTLTANPVAQYAILTQAILAGALFGLSAADATFTEQSADGE
ncbi:hypothetical protein [Mesorhizobium helmanticense]|uniref:Gene transfer agent family protein n=1 Tax=Mesorhizobium helmanticense TaxID=1776423 RepID=A0A2T4IRE7_9HYPH|nr:hypothetical protein [Mesorhizobium helmanticense]PTE08209.1 hypothetical protein C9427_21410 [Mesorhizobium helmanticense]